MSIGKDVHPYFQPPETISTQYIQDKVHKTDFNKYSISWSDRLCAYQISHCSVAAIVTRTKLFIFLQSLETTYKTSLNAISSTTINNGSGTFRLLNTAAWSMISVKTYSGYGWSLAIAGWWMCYVRSEEDDWLSEDIGTHTG